jgi:putative copper resistance protein D
MEHSALHALILIGLILSLGGPLAVLLLRGADASTDLLDTVARTTALGALAAAVGTLLDVGVQVAEVQGLTVFAGTDIELLGRFLSATTVGHLALARTGALLLAAALVWPARRSWLAVGCAAFGAVVLTSLVSHAAAQPEHRALAITGQVLHIAASAVWMGVLLHLFLLRRPLATEPSVVATVVRRFSPVALVATATILVTGLIAVLRALHSPAGVLGSAYGWTLLVKLGLIVPAVFAGWINYREIRPALARSAAALPRFFRMLELETLAGVMVVTIAGVLGSISPPGEDGSLTLTATQSHALLSPDFPTSHVDDWTAPEDPRGPTDDDLRYSELTHNWSGIVVICLGTCWLAQSLGGRAGWWAARVSPVLLIAFGCFIAAASNPELWLLRTVSPWEAIRNPQLLEHQIGAVLVFVLAGLAWRDRRRPAELRPLGWALPVIMIAGSLLLLGHAHSTLNIPDGLTNLVNVQHAIMGACGLFAGTFRLMQMRGLLPPRFAAHAWPSCVIALGIFMAFFYRELVPQKPIDSSFTLWEYPAGSLTKSRL